MNTLRIKRKLTAAHHGRGNLTGIPPFLQAFAQFEHLEHPASNIGLMIGIERATTTMISVLGVLVISSLMVGILLAWFASMRS